MSVLPTFYNDIRPLFTQYDRVMMMFYTDLWNYEKVKARAKSIHLCLQPAQPAPNPGSWSKLPEVHVMPVGTGPWSQDNIDLFGAWIAAGCPEGTAPPGPPPPSKDLPLFINLSQALTGFDTLAILENVDVLAQIYMDRLQASATYQADFATLMAALDATVIKDLIDKDGHIRDAYSQWLAVLQAITTLWYTAALDGDLGTPQNTQYPDGLEWRALSTHPMGFANENVPFYWQYEPGGGQYTGLIPWVQD